MLPGICWSLLLSRTLVTLSLLSPTLSFVCYINSVVSGQAERQLLIEYASHKERRVNASLFPQEGESLDQAWEKSERGAGVRAPMTLCVQLFLAFCARVHSMMLMSVPHTRRTSDHLISAHLTTQAKDSRVTHWSNDWFTRPLIACPFFPVPVSSMHSVCVTLSLFLFASSSISLAALCLCSDKCPIYEGGVHLLSCFNGQIHHLLVVHCWCGTRRICESVQWWTLHP